MIPEKDKLYRIEYTDPKYPDASYSGIAKYTGEIEEDSEESDLTKGFWYVFDCLEVEDDFLTYASFAEEDLIEEIKDNDLI